jgi:hypothetical protein
MRILLCIEDPETMEENKTKVQTDYKSGRDYQQILHMMQYATQHPHYRQ